MNHHGDSALIKEKAEEPHTNTLAIIMVTCALITGHMSTTRARALIKVRKQCITHIIFHTATLELENVLHWLILMFVN